MLQMKQLANKQILLGITGSIAAYKACELVRLLSDAGSNVRVVMTQSATEFVAPLTFQALSHNEVHRDLLDEKAEAGMGHIELARWADAIVIAPASANYMSRLAQGRADDLLAAICLATSAPLSVAPAMNQQMWKDAATQENVSTLKDRGTNILGPAEGDQACGETGPGRMLEPKEIAERIAAQFETGALAGLKVLVTSGPTREPIDPVRYISNRSSGLMGSAIAQAAIEAGASCTVISGPSNHPISDKATRIDIQTAQQMYERVMENIAECDIFISTAAVSDYRPTEQHDQKMKKTQQNLVIKLTRNPDILAEVAKNHSDKYCIGFAAETDNVEKNAVQKLNNKSIDMIVANNVKRNDIGFDSQDNEVTVYWQGGEKKLEKSSKHQIARQLIEIIAGLNKSPR
jgi:phosphopantothenoylcysteine decarboxylase/phosphopantothenate--cysteine ligase